VFKVVSKRWRVSVGDGRSRNRKPLGDGLGMGYFLNFNLSIKMLHSGVLFILFCTVNWLDVERLNIEVEGEGLTSEVGLRWRFSSRRTPHFNH